MTSPNSPTRRTLLRAVVACGVTMSLLAGFTGTAAATPDPGVSSSSLAGFFIGADGRLHAAGAGSTGAVSPTAVGVPGGAVATVRRPDGTIVVVTIGTHGGLMAGFTSAAGSGMRFVRDAQGGLAPPGGRIAAANGYWGTHVFFTGSNGAVHHARYSTSGVLDRLGPLTAPGAVPASASVAAFALGDRFGVVYAGADGGVRTAVGVISQGSGSIIWTVTSVPGAVAQAGSPVAAVANAAWAATAFYTGTDGRLWRIPFSGYTPTTPVSLSDPGMVPVGAHLAAAMASSGQFVVAYSGADGAIRAATNAFAPRPDPWTITLPGAHVPGSPLSVFYGEDDHLYFGWCGTNKWWWLFWRWLRRPPPPPPPDPYHDLIQLPTLIPTQPHYNVSVTMTF